MKSSFDSARLLAILSYRTACQLAHDAKSKHLYRDPKKLRELSNRFTRESDPLYYKYKLFCRQATLWNIVTCLAKGVEGGIHAPKAERGELLKIAKARWIELQDWAEKHETEKLISPLLEEYKERRKQRELRQLQEAEKCIA